MKQRNRMTAIKGGLFSLFAFAVLVLSACWTEPTEPAFKEYLRPGEDPGRGLYTNHQSLTNWNNTNVTVQGTVLLNVYDPDGDDHGMGNLQYPYNYETDILDIHQVVVSADATYLYFYVVMQDKYYQGPSAVANGTGFNQLFLGMFFGQESVTPAQTNLALYSPGDGSHGDQLIDLTPGYATTNVDILYGIAFLGEQNKQQRGSLYDAKNFGAKKTLGGNLYLIGTNDVTKTTSDYLEGVNTVLVFRVNRSGVLTAGAWKFTMFTYGWEDYDVPNAWPGNNGYLRVITSYAGTWNFGAGGSANLSKTRRCADILVPTFTAQSNILATQIIGSSDFYTINLP